VAGEQGSLRDILAGLRRLADELQLGFEKALGRCPTEDDRPSRVRRLSEATDRCRIPRWGYGRKERSMSAIDTGIDRIAIAGCGVIGASWAARDGNRDAASIDGGHRSLVSPYPCQE